MPVPISVNKCIAVQLEAFIFPACIGYDHKVQCNSYDYMYPASMYGISCVQYEKTFFIDVLVYG